LAARWAPRGRESARLALPVEMTAENFRLWKPDLVIES
jgi:hypothetical protein